MRTPNLPVWSWVVGIAAPAIVASSFALPILTDVQLPGTQPQEVGLLNSASQCGNCHGDSTANVEPSPHWRGSLMAQAGRDPLFWATVAVAEETFPESGDLCLRCHAPRGWIEGRSEPTDGSALVAGDEDGVECAICHQLVNPDGSEYAGVQNAPFIANDGGNPAEGFYGSGMMVFPDNNVRHGPYANTAARHAEAQSDFMRDSKMCGTCHDVSNPVTGDLAHNNGHMVPLPTGKYSGVVNGPITQKAAFQNPAYRYGVVERTFSEHQASAFESFLVRDYATLPAELQEGVLEDAYEAALGAGQQGDYADGTPRKFSCQTCHMMPTTGRGAKQNNAPVRTDLPSHDLTGGNTWVPELIKWVDQQNRLVLGGGMDQYRIDALDAGVLRARENLRRAAELDVHGDVLHVVNLTGHKLISGYPEGRRMWLRVTWRDRQGNVVRTDGEYGPIPATVNGTATTVDSLIDPYDPNMRIYRAEMGITQEWANQLIGLGWSSAFPVDYDRATGAVAKTLGQIAAQAPGTASHSFHFVLNNTMLHDERIPPYGFDYNEALTRSVLPVPATAYGDPGPGGTYRHWDEVAMQPPAGALRAEIELLYQPTSWEYVQFLLLANSGQNAVFGTAGQDLYDGWRATGMAAPEVMETANWCRLPGTNEDLELLSAVEAATPDVTCAKEIEAGETLHVSLNSPNGMFDGELGAFAFEFYGAAGAMPTPLLPGLQIDRIDGQILVLSLPGNGTSTSITIPNGLSGLALRCQGIVIAPQAQNSMFAASAAHDFLVE